MRTLACLLVLGLFLGACQRQRELEGDASIGAATLVPVREPPTGMPFTVTGDLKVAPGRYVRPPLARGADECAVLLEGLQGVTLDLRGVVLRAAERELAPDETRGRGLVLRDCADVTVLGGTFAGYREGVVLESCRDVLLDGLAVEGYFGRRLRSTSAAPDPADALLLDVQRAEEWLERYGAAIALFDCSRVTLRECRARGGQNGLVVARSESCAVHDCDFSFLSGWGVALHRAGRCVLSHNRVDYCARGYHHGRYAEPLGAAGILVAGRSTGNVFAHNRALHCGTGALVHASGGEPGAEDNLWVRNELAGALGHSYEERGARGSVLVENRMTGSLRGGILASDSSELALHGNEVSAAVGAALALSGGRGGLIVANVLRESDRGIELTRGARHSATESAAAPDREPPGAHWIIDNHLTGNVQDLVLEGVRELSFRGNRFSSPRPEVHLGGLEGIGAPKATASEVWSWLRGPDGSLPSGRAWDASLQRPTPESHPRMALLLELEPPALPAPSGGAPAARASGFEQLVLGPHGPWDFESGRSRPESPHPGGLFADCTWDAIWFHWDEASDPRGELATWRARRFEAPAARGQVRGGWSDPWGGAERRVLVGAERFGLVATTEVSIERGGTHALDVISDDGVRVWIDGVLVFEDWTWHPERRETVSVELEPGRRAVRLEYFQVDGAAALALSLERRPDS